MKLGLQRIFFRKNDVKEELIRKIVNSRNIYAVTKLLEVFKKDRMIFMFLV